MSLRTSALHEPATGDLRVALVRIAIALSATLMIAACASPSARVVARGEAPAEDATPAATGALIALHVRYTGATELPALGNDLSYGTRKTGTMRASLSLVRSEARVGSGHASGEVAAPSPAVAVGSPGARNVRHPDPPQPATAPVAPPDDVDLASIAFDVPTTMTLERRTLIQLALSGATKEHEANLAGAAVAPMQHARQYVEARLSGNGFIVEPVTGDTQAVGGPDATRWLWLVTPTQSGEHRLRVTVAALSDPTGTPMRRALPAFEHTIHVRTSWMDELRARVPVDATWLLAVILAAPLALAWLYLRWRRKHRRWFHGRL